MAYMNRPRESRAGAQPMVAKPSVRRRLRSLRARAHRFRDSLPLACLLCDTRTPGGLCEHCRSAVCASMDTGARCPRCDLRLPATSDLQAGECPDCRDLSPALSQIVAAFDYEWPGDLLIQRLKLQGRFSCAPVIARMMALRLQAVMDLVQPVVTAVPPSRSSIVLRGYNPAAELGRALARRVDLEWRPELLRRSKEGAAQKGLGRDARRAEVQGLYQASAHAAGKTVLVVDDVMTTGSTLDAIAAELTGQGARVVWAVVAARTGVDRQR